MQNSQPNIDPLSLAIELISDTAKALGCKQPRELRTIGYMRLLMTMHPGIETVIPTPDRVFYRVDDETANQLGVMAQGDRISFEVVKEICAANVYNGEPIPSDLRNICFSLIRGDKVGPSTKGKLPGQEFCVRFTARLAIKYLDHAYEDLPATRNEASAPCSAADTVRDALDKLGMHFEYVTVRDWTKSRKDDTFTYWAHSVEDLYYENLMLHYGLVKKRKKRIMNPWGQYAPIQLSNRYAD